MPEPLPASKCDQIRPFRIAVPQADIDDLQRRLANTRWPERETVEDMSQGVPLARLRKLVNFWKSDYDWRRTEARLNSWPNFITEIDGLDIHFLHIRSPQKDALPLIMTHGWPGSIVEFMDIIGPLTDPVGHGGTAEQAFHLVLPSLPGYGFSGKPNARGWDVDRIARAWHELMLRLGYDRYVAQGGDWGAMVSQFMGRMAPAGLAGVHVNFPVVMPDDEDLGNTPEETAALDAIDRFYAAEAGYFQMHVTRPQTIGYALADSPVGQAAWILEKLMSWTDGDGEAEALLGMDKIVAMIMLYWLTNSAASSARLYWENAELSYAAIRIDIPVAVSLFPKEHYTPPRAWAERAYSRLVYWNKVDAGGHFAAMEQPGLFTEELRAAFTSLRQHSASPDDNG